MQLKLKRKGDYTVRAMISVARHWGVGFRQGRQIAAEMEIPYKFLTQILAELVGKGLLVAKHGPAGGYALARPPTDITLLDVVEAGEGPATFNHCVLRDGPCDWEETCPVHDTWSRAQAALAKELASTTLADLAGIDAAIEAGGYQSEAPSHRDSTERHGERN
ncbi:MAG: Rrf2 family transcriptional regulator [Acidimicrobiia bacterium]|nr:Rrf2 family transcriptional regulator [Acidimicrobiia bacterium]MDH3471566.1 Rrf2 family transcriptional regulator [Acidimicrobiia bacterium]